MCIRDRSACAVEGTPSKAVYAVCRDRNRAMNSFRISLSPVSYTHLDVYKRQVKTCKKFQINKEAIIETIGKEFSMPEKEVAEYVEKYW